MTHTQDSLQSRTRRNNTVLAWWTGGWLLSTALATFGPLLIWDRVAALSVSAILVNLLVGIGMILANKKYLLGLDELQQRILLEAMAITLGICLVGGIAYSLLEISQLIGFHAEISHLILLMGLSLVSCTLLLNRRYR